MSASSPNTPETQELAHLKVRAAELNARIHTAQKGSRERACLSAEFMQVSAEIVRLKAIVHEQNQEANAASRLAREGRVIAAQEEVKFFVLQAGVRQTGYVNIATPGEVQTQLLSTPWFVVNCFTLTDEQAEQMPEEYNSLPA